MNRVLVTGLALGKESGICSVCNYDFDWLIRYPSVLLWADSILVSGAIWDSVSSGQHPAQYPVLAKCLQLIFDIARAEGIVQSFNTSDIIPEDAAYGMFSQIEKDVALLCHVFPDHVAQGDDDKVPGQVFVDGYEYCSPHLWSIHASLALARALDAHCLFGDRAFNYCRYKFGLSSFPTDAEPGRLEGFHRVFEAYIPNTAIFPGYVLSNKELCSHCSKEEGCRDEYLSELEKNLKQLLTWRDYDEIQQVKAVVDQVVRRRSESGGVIDPAGIVDDFRSEESKLRRRVRLVFPRVRRWANIGTVLSVPVALAGVATGSPLLTAAGAGGAGLSQAAKELVELLSSRYSWIGFVSKEAELHREM